MSPTRRAQLKRWATNPRTGMVISLSILAGAFMAFVILSGLNTRDALRARQSTATAASRRIDKLNRRIEVLGTQVAGGESRIGALQAQVDALQTQLEREGEQPIVVRTTTTSRPRSSTTSTTRPPSTTSTTQPSTTTTTTTRPCQVQVVVCLNR